ncbi:hypothetical protein [Xanthomonas oryzae]|uniref:hypothetical protein n=2 Tax=Xanthomonas oryzae TaxID=347 RepID=UPI00211D11D6|nr:hypothetical protein [Xanthomonas oryzae]
MLVYLLYCCWFQVNQVALGGLHEPAFIRGILMIFLLTPLERRLATVLPCTGARVVVWYSRWWRLRKYRIEAIANVAMLLGIILALVWVSWLPMRTVQPHVLPAGGKLGLLGECCSVVVCQDGYRRAGLRSTFMGIGWRGACTIDTTVTSKNYVVCVVDYVVL